MHHKENPTAESQPPPAAPDTRTSDGAPALSDNDKFILMARKVIWALKYLKARSAGMVAISDKDPTAFKICHWTTDFCNALEQCGIEIDREAVDRIHGGKKTKKQT